MSWHTWIRRFNAAAYQAKRHPKGFCRQELNECHAAGEEPVACFHRINDLYTNPRKPVVPAWFDHWMSVI